MAKNPRDFKFVESLPDKFKCELCKQLLLEPHVTECCGQHFCQQCIEKSTKTVNQRSNTELQRVGNPWGNQWARSPKAVTSVKQEQQCCPGCQATSFKHMRYLPLKRKINDLKVYCPHKDNGCGKQVMLGEIENHVTECDYQSVWCTNRCGQALLRKDLRTHCTRDCTYRIIACQYCQKRDKYVTIMYSHTDNCPDYPLTCTNNCGEKNIKRKDMSSHKEVCPREIIGCTFAEAGCTEWMYREDMPNHIHKNVEKHLSLLMVAHLKLKQEVQQMNQ